MCPFRPRPTQEWPELLCLDVFSDWLAASVSCTELAGRVARLFRERGPGMPRRMRADLEAFLEDRSAVALARCLAMNEEPSACDAFVRWCREVSGDWRDTRVRLGLRRGDTCVDAGPGEDRR